ncbi:hypothetical protein HYT01_00310 [Candidatus Giovannonibacteria bacterium]|nr:hypothetical protein [Candidatus Giovannonibacteria bacterium]
MVAENKNEIRPLCLSFWTPPTVRPQAILIGKMIPEWIRQGIKPVIVNYGSNGDWEINAQIYKISQFKLNKYLNRIPPLRGYLRRRYYNDIAEQLAGIVKKHDLNIIFSFANPQESNIIGAIVKEKTGVLFVSHFSDPWYDNPWSKMSWWRKKIVLKQETKIIKNSDAVIFINASMRDMVMKKYPREWQDKGAVIHHSFAESDYPLANEEVKMKKSKEKFVFSHVGAFYKARNPEILFKALKKIISENRSLSGKIEFRLVGYNSGYTDFTPADMETLINKYDLGSVVKLIGQVGYRDSLQYMQLADCLVLIDVEDAESWCFPSKVVDYAGSGAAILGVTSKDSPVWLFLEKLGYRCFTYGEVDKLAWHMKELIEGRFEKNVNKEYLQEFSAASNIKKLLELFSDLVSK